MSISEEINSLAEKVAQVKGDLQSEEATKLAMPNRQHSTQETLGDSATILTQNLDQFWGSGHLG